MEGQLSFQPDSLDQEEVVVATETEEKAVEEAAGGEEEVVIEVEGGKSASKAAETDDSKAELERLKSEVLQLSQALHDVKKEKPKAEKKGGEEEISRADLVAVIAKHKDDPEVLLRVFEHVAESTSNKKAETVLEQQQKLVWSDRMSTFAQQALDSEPAYKDVGYRRKVGELVEKLGFGDHPAGELAAFAILQMADLKGKVQEAEKKEKLEEGRKKEIVGKKVQSKGDNVKKDSGPVGKLTAAQLEFCKKRGMKPEYYAKFVVGENK